MNIYQNFLCTQKPVNFSEKGLNISKTSFLYPYNALAFSFTKNHISENCRELLLWRPFSAKKCNIIIKDPRSPCTLLFISYGNGYRSYKIIMGHSKGFSTASWKYWIKKVRNGENYSPISICNNYHELQFLTWGITETTVPYPFIVSCIGNAKLIIHMISIIYITKIPTKAS